MRRVDWSRARHVLTVVDQGGTSRVLVDVSPSLTVRFTPPVDSTNPNAVLWGDGSPSLWGDGTTMEWAS